MSYNNEFLDNMDMINNLAKKKGFVNGIAWSDAARKSGIISDFQHVEHEKCHKIRNLIAHGNAKDIAISMETLNITKEFLKRITNEYTQNEPTKKEAVKPIIQSPLPKKEQPTNAKIDYDKAVAFVNQFEKVSQGFFIKSNEVGTKEKVKENLALATNALQHLENYLKYTSDVKKVETFKMMRSLYSQLETTYYLTMMINAKLCRVFKKYKDQSVENCESCYLFAHKQIVSRNYNYDSITISELKSCSSALNEMIVALNKINEIYG